MIARYLMSDMVPTRTVAAVAGRLLQEDTTRARLTLESSRKQTRTASTGLASEPPPSGGALASEIRKRVRLLAATCSFWCGVPALGLEAGLLAGCENALHLDIFPHISMLKNKTCLYNFQ